MSYSAGLAIGWGAHRTFFFVLHVILKCNLLTAKLCGKCLSHRDKHFPHSFAIFCSGNKKLEISDLSFLVPLENIDFFCFFLVNLTKKYLGVAELRYQNPGVLK